MYVLHSVGSSNPLLFVCFSEHLVVNMAAGRLEFEVVNEPVKFPEDVDFLDHAIGSESLLVLVWVRDPFDVGYVTSQTVLLRLVIEKVGHCDLS